jgi:predicted nucleic acid-binding protein
MSAMNVVDANVVLSGLRSRNGASHFVLRGMLTGEVAFTASPAVVLEYEDLLKRPGCFGPKAWIEADEVDRVLDAICAKAVPALSTFRFRPILLDPKDDMYVECALAGGAETIISFDRGFRTPALREFGIRVLSPGELLQEGKGVR